MAKFELTLVHRLDNGVAKSVNKIQADTLISLSNQMSELLDNIIQEVKELNESEKTDDLPF